MKDVEENAENEDEAEDNGDADMDDDDEVLEPVDFESMLADVGGIDWAALGIDMKD